MAITIYQIRNTITNRRYIGSTGDTIKRQASHFYELRNNKHSEDLLQRDFNMLGEKYFVFEEIEACEDEMQQEREQFWMNVWRDGYCLYNANSRAKKTHKHTPEQIEKMSAKAKCRIPHNKGKKTGKPAWNSGLTRETDKRVDNGSRKSGITYKQNKHVPWNKGLKVAPVGE